MLLFVFLVGRGFKKEGFITPISPVHLSKFYQGERCIVCIDTNRQLLIKEIMVQGENSEMVFKIMLGQKTV